MAQTEVLRQSILKKAFEGTLIAQYSTDEPANLLLQKIRIEKSNYLKKLINKKNEEMIKALEK